MTRGFLLLFAYIAFLGALVYAAWPAEQMLDLAQHRAGGSIPDEAVQFGHQFRHPQRSRVNLQDRYLLAVECHQEPGFRTGAGSWGAPGAGAAPAWSGSEPVSG